MSLSLKGLYSFLLCVIPGLILFGLVGVSFLFDIFLGLLLVIFGVVFVLFLEFRQL